MTYNFWKGEGAANNKKDTSNQYYICLVMTRKLKQWYVRKVHDQRSLDCTYMCI